MLSFALNFQIYDELLSTPKITAYLAKLLQTSVDLFFFALKQGC